jgi:hypothetical protein
MFPDKSTTGTAEREAAIGMIENLPAGRRIWLGAGKAYGTADFAAKMRRLGVTRHVAQNNKRRRSAIAARVGCILPVSIHQPWGRYKPAASSWWRLDNDPRRQ